MKLFKALATVALMSFSAVSMANLYLPGTEAHRMVASLEQFIPSDVEIAFIVDGDRAYFVNDMNAKAVEGRTELQALITKAHMTARSNTIASPVYASLLRNSKGRNDQGLCAILTTEARFLATSYMHEIMHCITLANSERYDVAAAIARYMDNGFKGARGEVVNNTTKHIVAMEVHARLLAYSIFKKSGLDADMKSLRFMIDKQYPVNSGKHSLKVGINLCETKGCATDASDLMAQLMADPTFVNAIKADLSVANDYYVKTGKIRP